MYLCNFVICLLCVEVRPVQSRDYFTHPIASCVWPTPSHDHFDLHATGTVTWLFCVLYGSAACAISLAQLVFLVWCGKSDQYAAGQIVYLCSWLFFNAASKINAAGQIMQPAKIVILNNVAGQIVKLMHPAQSLSCSIYGQKSHAT